MLNCGSSLRVYWISVPVVSCYLFYFYLLVLTPVLNETYCINNIFFVIIMTRQIDCFKKTG